MQWALIILIAGGLLVISKSASARTFMLSELAGDYAAPIEAAEKKYGIPPGLLLRQLYQESSFDPEARSRVGALGIAQFMPATAKDFNLNPLDPLASIEAAAKYMAQLYKATGSWTGALASYNWGIGNWKKSGFSLAKAPQETRDYVARIAGDMAVG